MNEISSVWKTYISGGIFVFKHAKQNYSIDNVNYHTLLVHLPSQYELIFSKARVLNEF